MKNLKAMNLQMYADPAPAPSTDPAPAPSPDPAPSTDAAAPQADTAGAVS